MQLDKILLKIIEKESCQEQEDIIKLLDKEGINITQSSLSRRLKKMKITKINGIYRKQEKDIYTGLLKQIDIALPNMLILHTLPGSASSFAYKIDQLIEYKNSGKPEIKGILGTIAGDDTIFVAIDNKYSLEAIKNQLLRLLSFVE